MNAGDAGPLGSRPGRTGATFGSFTGMARSLAPAAGGGRLPDSADLAAAPAPGSRPGQAEEHTDGLHRRGQLCTYLRSYADAVIAFGHPVILSFGHEMNGTWYSWGYGHPPPATFVAAWRHIVRIFRAAGAANVTWLWTVIVAGCCGRTCWSAAAAG